LYSFILSEICDDFFLQIAWLHLTLIVSVTVIPQIVENYSTAVHSV